MGLMDDIQTKAAEKAERDTAYLQAQEQKVIDGIIAKINYPDGPTPVFIERLNEKEYSRTAWGNQTVTHKLFYVISIDDVIVHATVKHGVGTTFYSPQTCVGCRKMERVHVRYFTTADSELHDGKPSVDSFVESYAKTLSDFRTRQHSRCWECRKELP